MNAPEESVRAVEEALGCERVTVVARSMLSPKIDGPSSFGCMTHPQQASDRGCPVAVVAADAAVAALYPTTNDLVSHDGTLVRRIASASWDLPIE